MRGMRQPRQTADTHLVLPLILSLEEAGGEQRSRDNEYEG